MEQHCAAVLHFQVTMLLNFRSVCHSVNTVVTIYCDIFHDYCFISLSGNFCTPGIRFVNCHNFSQYFSRPTVPSLFKRYAASDVSIGFLLWRCNIQFMLRRSISSSLKGISCSTIRSFLAQAVSARHIFFSLQHSQLTFTLGLAVACLVGGWGYWKRPVNAAVTFANCIFLHYVCHKSLFSFYFSVRISPFWASELITLTSNTMTGSNKS
jgi:hypothetical protein